MTAEPSNSDKERSPGSNGPQENAKLEERGISDARGASRLRKIRRRLFWKLPSVFPDPDYKETLRSMTRRDGCSNKKTEPISTEAIDLRCVWAVEFYTPSHAEALKAALAKLGWDRDKPLREPDRNPKDWIAQQRLNTTRHGTYSLGTIIRESDKRRFHDARIAPLPDPVDYAFANIHGMTSSLTCILICFVLKDGRARSFDDALRKKRATYMQRHKSSYRIYDPHRQKSSDIHDIRIELSDMARCWFRDHIPGVFSSGLLDNFIPTCEFLTLRDAEPFPKRDRREQAPNFLQPLGADFAFETWVHKNSGLKFAWPIANESASNLDFHAIVGARESDLESIRPSYIPRHSRSSDTSEVSNIVEGLIVCWSLVALISGFERQVNRLRDSDLLRQSSSYNYISRIRGLRSKLTQSVDISAVSEDLSVQIERDRLLSSYIEPFGPLETDIYSDKNTTFAKALAENLSDRIKRLGVAERAMRDALLQDSAISGVIENTIMQKKIKRMTWLVTLLTMLMAIITALTFIQSGENLKIIISTIESLI